MSGAETPSRQTLFWACQIGGWGLFGAGMFAAGVSQWPLAYTAVVKASLTLLGFTLSLLLRVVYRFFARRSAPAFLTVACAIPLCFGAAGIWMAGYNLVTASYVARQRWMPALALRRFPDFTNTIYYFFVLSAWSALYFGVLAYLDLIAERERLLRAEGLAHRARLQTLRLQLNPHFLFNTLNAVSTLVAESRTAEANRMISRLSDFLRRTLDQPDIDEVPLAEEIGFVREYLEIEGVRFGDRLRVELSVAPNAEDALVPAMILQPLVENAVRHGVLAREDGGMIVIQAVREGQSLRLEVHDDGPGVGAIEAVNAGVGLSNTRERLTELYGTNAELLLSRSGHGGLEASIRLPYRVATQGTA